MFKRRPGGMRGGRCAQGAVGLEGLEPRVQLTIDPADVPRPVLALPSGTDIELVRAIDLNADGAAELVAGAGGVVYVLRNRGDGTFRKALLTALPADEPSLPGAQVRMSKFFVADFDGDGHVDVLVHGTVGVVERGSFHRSWLLTGNGRGRLELRSVQRDSYADSQLALASETLAIDVDGDGAEDLVTMRGLRAYGFQDGELVIKGPIARGGGWQYTGRESVADLDGDGDLDVVTTRNVARTPVILRNNGQGFDIEELSDVRDLPVPTARDLTGDGRPEVVFAGVATRNGERFVQVAAMVNVDGAFAGSPVVLFEESWVEVLARGGHAASLASGPAYSAGLVVEELADVDMDGQLDIRVRIDSAAGPFWGVFEERFRLVLRAGVAPGPDQLAVYTPQTIESDLAYFDPWRSLRGRVTTADLDGQGEPDGVLVSRTAVRAGQWGGAYVGGNNLFVLSGESGAAAGDIAAIKGGAPFSTGVRAGESVLAHAVFRERTRQSTIVEVDAFLDSNANGRLDGMDRRIGRTTTTDVDEYGNTRWLFTLTRRPAWGTGFRTVFFAAVDAQGRVSTPTTDRVQLL